MKNIYLLTIDWATRDDANTAVFAYANFEDAKAKWEECRKDIVKDPESDGFYDDEAEVGDVETVNGFVMMDHFREETLIGLINEIWTLDIVEYSEKVDSAQQKATQFSTVEDVLKQMGALRPLKKNGDLSEKGWVAFETLRNFLSYLAQQNVVKFYEDKLDEFIDKD